MGYGALMMVAFDLHRFDLLNALHLPLLADSDSEKTANQTLNAFLASHEKLVYRHPDSCTRHPALARPRWRSRVKSIRGLCDSSVRSR